MKASSLFGNRSGSGAAASAGLLISALLAVAAPAHAAPKSIGGFVGGSAGINTGGLFTQPRDIAVFHGNDADRSNDRIYVVESLNNNSRVQRLDGDGNFELIWGRDAIRTGFPGDTGNGFEICSRAVSGAAGCKATPAGSAAGELDDPGALAVNQATGDVYVFDRDNRRIQRYSADGMPLGQWGTAGSGAGQLGATTGRVGIAVAPGAPHDVLVADPANRRVLQFQADGTFVRGWGFGVADGQDAFQVCTATCQAGNTTGSAGRFASGWPRDVAVDDDGIVYASDGTGDRIVRFDADLFATPATALMDPLPSPALLTAGTTTGLEVDPGSGNLLVARIPSSGPVFVQEVSDPGADLVGPPAPAVVDTHVYSDVGSVQGLGFDPTNGNLYLSVPDFFQPPDGPFVFDGECALNGGNRICGGLMVLSSQDPPTIATVGSGEVGTTTAEVAATVDAHGGVARYRFEVSRDGITWEGVGDGYVSGSGARAVSADATGLEPATLYRMRMTLSKQSGISTFHYLASGESTFLTDAAPPAVQTLGSDNRTSTGATLRGRVDPNGSNTSYRFEIGPAGGSFDRRVPIPDAPAGSGNAPQLVTYDLSGLQPATAYHYRVVATNFVGESVGETAEFETLVGDATSPTPGRAFELVSPADKLSGVGVGAWYLGPATVAFSGEPAHEGERFASRAEFGSVLLDGEYAWANDWALGDRTEQGWVSEPVASRRGHGTQYKAFLNMKAAAPDLSLMTWRSNSHVVTPFPEMEGWDQDLQNQEVLLMRDWPGAWEAFVGTSGDPRVNKANPAGQVAVAADSSLVVATGRGLGGEGDPSIDGDGPSVFVDDVSAGLSDTFPGEGIRRPANVCTEGTELPAVVDAGGGDLEQGAQDCAAPEPGRYARLIGDRGAELPDRPGAVSDDGDRVFFTSGEASSCSGTGAATSCPAQLFVWQREGDDVVTRWLSRTLVAEARGASDDQAASLMGSVAFEGASADGDKVLFSTSSVLTADDRNGQGVAPPAGGIVAGTPQSISRDLFAYDLADGGDPTDGGQLTRISAGPNGDGDCNVGGAQPGSLRQVSDDGSRVYFTCSAPLPGVPVAGDGTIADPAGTPSSIDFLNLYLYDANRSGADRWRFVARLPRSSALGRCAAAATGNGASLMPDSAAVAAVQVVTGNSCVRATPDGSTVVFWTDGRLTGDDPDAVSGDVYAYDAVDDVLTRVSAPAGGVGGTYQCGPGGVSPAPCYGDLGIGDPGGAPIARLSVGAGVDGVPVVFFQSRSRLLPNDTDNAYDVYQWRAGTLTLVTTGVSSTDGALLIGADRDGRNVFFGTRDRLTWQDSDAVLDVYSARVGGGIPQPPAPPVCGVLTGGCQGPGATPAPPPAVESDDPPASGDADPPVRVAVTVGRPSKRALRRAGRSGKLTVPVRLSSSGTVDLAARARVKGRSRVVAGGSARLDRPGVAKLRLRLSRAARKVLARRHRLSVQLVAKVDGARPGRLNVTIGRAGR